MLQTGPDVTGLGRADARKARIEFWREKVNAAVSSGQTQAEFCRAQGLSAGAYFWWKRVLTRIDRGTRPAAAASRRKLPKRGLFLPVTVREPRAETSAEHPLEIALGAGRVIRVREGCDPKLLEAVIRMVGGLPC
jgi:hypothetical protein